MSPEPRGEPDTPGYTPRADRRERSGARLKGASSKNIINIINLIGYIINKFVFCLGARGRGELKG